MRLVQMMAFRNGKRRNPCWPVLVFALLMALTAQGFEQKPPAAPAPGSAAVPAAASAAKAAVIRDITTAREKDSLVVSVNLDRPTIHREFSLIGPDRLVIDFNDAEIRVPFLNLPVNHMSVRQLRMRQFQTSKPKVARLVFDLENSSAKHEVIDAEGMVRIVFHQNPADAQSVADKGAVKAQSPAAQAGPAPKAVAHAPVKPPAQQPKPARQEGQTAAVTKSPDAKPKDAPRQKDDAPVIRDLARAEIPLSSLEGEGKSKPAPRAEAEPPKPAPPAEAAVTTPAPAPPEPLVVPGGRFMGQPLTLDLVDIPLVDFFRLMSEEGGINVVMDPEVKGNVSIKVVKVPWDQIFEAVLINHGLEKQMEGNMVRIALKQTLQKEAKMQEELKKANLLAADLETRVKRLNYAKAASFVAPLTEMKTARGTVVIDERTNSLVLTDLPASIEKMVQLVESLDTPQPQVEIEARIVSATRDFARDIGIQFGFVQGNLERVTVGGPNTFGTIGGTRPSATPVTTFAAGNPRTGRGAADSTSSQSAGVSTGTGNKPAGNLNVNLPAQKAFGGLGISVGNIFDTFLLDAAITAGEAKGLAKLISQPKLVAQNNTSGVITQGLRFPVQVLANNTVTVQFMNAALTLTVTPQITYEGNLVLDLKVENNTPDFSRQVNGIPSIHTSESSTKVLVTDGGTTMIGGILIDSETTQEDRIPGLASLPMIGNLFKRSLTSHSTEEVLFFVTPRIIK